MACKDKGKGLGSPRPDNHPFILGGRVHSRLVAMEGLVALMRNANGAAFAMCSAAERDGVFCAFDVLLREAKHIIGTMNELAGPPAMEEKDPE